MKLQPVGNTWLQGYFKLNRHILTHNSYIANNPSIELTSRGNVEQVYGPRYAPGEDTPMAHLEFSLKYDDLNLDFLKDVFSKIEPAEIINFINQAPTSRYSRKIGFLYEFLTDQELKPGKAISGNYIDLLDPKHYITASGVNIKKWRITDNLLGTRSFCPMVRYTNEVKVLINENIPEKLENLKREFSPDIFRRATNYLYKKETKSSYEIEREEPSPDRMEKFIALLMQAGRESKERMLEEQRLVQLQNAIVDPRFAAQSFRDYQNYIGQSLPNYRDLIHYICPPPQFVESLMQGLSQTLLKSTSLPPEIRAAITAFGFVFIHPFEDGNGRIHRFLIHDILVSDGLVPGDTIIPVSAHMLHHMHDYDSILESYSKPLMQFIRYDKKEEGDLVVTNADAVEGYFRYPDLTEHCIYLIKTLHATLLEDMPDELNFIQRYDEVKREIQNIVDMPDKLINLMILFLHQNKGVFPKKRRKQFEKLSDEEIEQMQAAYQNVFESNES
jgi:Fic family protein